MYDGIDFDEIYCITPIESPIFSGGLSIAAKTIYRFSGYSQEVADFFMRLQKRKAGNRHKWTVDHGR